MDLIRLLFIGIKYLNEISWIFTRNMTVISYQSFSYMIFYLKRIKAGILRSSNNMKILLDDINKILKKIEKNEQKQDISFRNNRAKNKRLPSKFFKI